MQRVGLQLHALTGGFGGRRPVEHPDRRARLEGVGRALRDADIARIGGLEIGDGRVEIGVDLLEHHRFVGAAHPQRVFQIDVVGVERHVAPQKDQIGVEAGAEEGRLALEPLQERLGDQTFAARTFDIRENGIGPRDSRIIAPPALLDLSGLGGEIALKPVVEIVALVVVVREAVGVVETRRLPVPVGFAVELVDGHLELRLGGEPVLARSLGQRVQIQILTP